MTFQPNECSTAISQYSSATSETQQAQEISWATIANCGYLVYVLGVEFLESTQMLLMLYVQLVPPLSLQLLYLSSMGTTQLLTL